MDSSLLEAFSSYQATLCVFLIVISVSLLWIYVTIIRGKAVEPNFDVLYEKSSTHTAGSKKSPKNKAKGKQQVEGSPKPGKVKAVGEVSGSSHTKEKESNIKKRPTTKTQTTVKKQASKRKSQADTHVESNASLDSENEGGWQTQLSRPQLRALRQMQKKAKESGADGQSQAGVGREGSSSSGGGGGGDSSGDGRLSEKENTKSSKGQKKKGKQAARKSPDMKAPDTSAGTASDEGNATKTSADTGASGQDPQEVGSTNGESSGEGAAGGEGLSSSSFPVTCNSSVQDVEGALREAALCSSSNSKNEMVTTLEKVPSQEQPDTAKTTQKRKRTKRKNKQPPQESNGSDSSKTPVASKNDKTPSGSGKESPSTGGDSREQRPPSVGRESGDDWVVID